jgi:hypothetical protein
MILLLEAWKHGCVRQLPWVNLIIHAWGWALAFNTHVSGRVRDWDS